MNCRAEEDDAIAGDSVLHHLEIISISGKNFALFNFYEIIVSSGQPGLLRRVDPPLYKLDRRKGAAGGGQGDPDIQDGLDESC